jgi:phosphoglycerate dehydrogenase-like enzyme
MQKPVVLVTNRIFPETEALLAAHARAIVNRADEPWSREEVQARCREADAMLAFMTDQVDAAFFTGCPRLKVVGAALKGYDNIDVAAAERAGVWVTIVPDLLTIPTAELAIGLMLSLGRHIAAADRSIRDNGFRGWRPAFYGRGIAGATVGIVVSARSARRLQPAWPASAARSWPAMSAVYRPGNWPIKQDPRRWQMFWPCRTMWCWRYRSRPPRSTSSIARLSLP